MLLAVYLGIGLLFAELCYSIVVSNGDIYEYSASANKRTYLLLMLAFPGMLLYLVYLGFKK